MVALLLELGAKIETISRGFPLHYAIKSGSVPTVEVLMPKPFWRLMYKGIEIDMYATEHASLEMLNFLHGRGVKFSNDTTERAVKYGRFEVLQWLHEIGVSMTVNALAMAVRANNTEAATYIIER